MFAFHHPGLDISDVVVSRSAKDLFASGSTTRCERHGRRFCSINLRLDAPKFQCQAKPKCHEQAARQPIAGLNNGGSS